MPELFLLFALVFSNLSCANTLRCLPYLFCVFTPNHLGEVPALLHIILAAGLCMMLSFGMTMCKERAVMTHVVTFQIQLFESRWQVGKSGQYSWHKINFIMSSILMCYSGIPTLKKRYSVENPVGKCAVLFIRKLSFLRRKLAFSKLSLPQREVIF